MNWRAGLLVGSLGLAALAPLGCGNGGSGGGTSPNNNQKHTQGQSDAGTPDSGTPDAGTPDSGTPDAGTPDSGTPDAGQPDAGMPDGGSIDGGTDAGTPDGGEIPEPPPSTVTELPSTHGFQLFAIQHDDGSPVQVNGITSDEGGNIWVAAGTDGLFVLRKGATIWQQFTLKDGLHPYGYDIDGHDLPPPYYLEVLSVAGGPAGTVFVGYRGRPIPGHSPNEDTCETNWDDTKMEDAKDPTVYQSGDADRVTLNDSGGIDVVHYDIFSGPQMVPEKCSTLADGTQHCTGEPAGRERVCSIYRILYDKDRSNVWFGGNHGFAWGDPTYRGIQAAHCYGPYVNASTPSFGNYNCSGILEHAHPLVEASNGGVDTYRYYGLSVSPSDGSLWVGGWIRSVHYGFGSHGSGFWTYEGNQSDPSWYLDVWPNASEDAIFATAALPDGSAWMGAWGNGAARLDSSGNVIQYLTTHNGLLDNNVTAAAADPAGSGVWFGYNYGGLAHYNGSFQNFSYDVFGTDQSSQQVTQLYDDAPNRRLLLSFANGVVGIYPE